MKYFLVLDVGTTGVKGFVFDSNLKLLAKSYYRLSKQTQKKGWVEQNPKELVNKSILALRRVVKVSGVSPSKLTSMGITNQRETTILWDKKTGRTVYPAIVWEDTRTQKRVQVLKKRFNNLVRNKTGLPIDSYFSASKAEWILKNIPRAKTLLERNDLLFGTVDTWILWNLSQEKSHITDYTNASRTLLFNIKNLSWDQELMDIFGIPKSILPKVKPSSSLFGHLVKSLIGKAVPIYAMCGDQQASMYAAGVKSGTTKITYGTGTFMMHILGSKFAKHKEFFTTLTATKNTPLYALENKINCCGPEVDKLLKKKISLVPIITKISKQVAADIKRLPNRPTKIFVDGGLTQSPYLQSIQSKSAHIPVIKHTVHDGTALGLAKLLADQ